MSTARGIAVAVSDEQITRFAKLFRGNETHHYIANFVLATKEPGGKVVPKYERLPGPATDEDFARHLRGEMGLLVVPVTAAGTAHFGAIDDDSYPADPAGLQSKVLRSGLPIVVSPSKSGGAHLWWLRKDHPLMAADLREVLAGWAAELGYTKVEIFPKQDALAPGDYGGGINLPCFGGKGLEPFLTAADAAGLVRARRPGAVELDDAVEILLPYWTDGQRDRLNLAILGMLARAKVDEAEAQQLVDAVANRAGDNQSHKLAALVYRDVEHRGKQVPGFTRCVELMGRESAKALLAAVGATPPAPAVPFELQPLAGAWLQEAPPPLTYTLKPLLPSRTTALLVAEGGAGKTTMALRIAVAVATGEALFGMPVDRGRVVYLAMEDQADSLRRRVWHITQRQQERMRLEGRAPEMLDRYHDALKENFFLIPGAGHQLHLVSMQQGQVVQNEAVLSELIEKIKALGAGTRLLIADPMSRMNGAEENNNAVGTALVNAAERIARECGCTVLIAHHTGKAAARDRDATQYSARGASALADAARSVIRMLGVDEKRATQDGLNVPGEVIAVGDLVEVLHVKCNDGPKAPPFMLRRQELDFELFVPATESREDRHARAMRAMWAWFCGQNKEPFTLKDMAPNLKGVPREAARVAFNKAKADGDLVEGARVARSHSPRMAFRVGYTPPVVEVSGEM